MKNPITRPFLLLILLSFWVMFSIKTSGQQNPLIGYVYSPCYVQGYPPSNVYDGNLSTYYAVHPFLTCNPTSICLDMYLTKTVKALEITITASVAGISVRPGSTSNYHKTIMNTETFYIIKPEGFSQILFTNDGGYGGYAFVYEIELNEIDLDAVSLPFDYDNAGNMINRTILLGSTKGSTAEAPTSEESDSSKEEPTDLDKMLSFGDVVIYPNPTRGELRIETDFDDDALTNGFLKVYSINGSQILHKIFNTGTATISIADQPSGVYILILDVNGETHRWNIIKE